MAPKMSLKFQILLMLNRFLFIRVRHNEGESKKLQEVREFASDELKKVFSDLSENGGQLSNSIIRKLETHYNTLKNLRDRRGTLISTCGLEELEKAMDNIKNKFEDQNSEIPGAFAKLLPGEKVGGYVRLKRDFFRMCDKEEVKRLNQQINKFKKGKKQLEDEKEKLEDEKKEIEDNCSSDEMKLRKEKEKLQKDYAKKTDEVKEKEKQLEDYIKSTRGSQTPEQSELSEELEKQRKQMINFEKQKKRDMETKDTKIDELTNSLELKNREHEQRLRELTKLRVEKQELEKKNKQLESYNLNLKREKADRERAEKTGERTALDLPYQQSLKSAREARKMRDDGLRADSSDEARKLLSDPQIRDAIKRKQIEEQEDRLQSEKRRNYKRIKELKEEREAHAEMVNLIDSQPISYELKLEAAENHKNEVSKIDAELIKLGEDISKLIPVEIRLKEKRLDAEVRKYNPMAPYRKGRQQMHASNRRKQIQQSQPIQGRERVLDEKQQRELAEFARKFQERKQKQSRFRKLISGRNRGGGSKKKTKKKNYKNKTKKRNSKKRNSKKRNSKKKKTYKKRNYTKKKIILKDN